MSQENLVCKQSNVVFITMSCFMLHFWLLLAESDRDYVSFHSRHSPKIQEFNDDKNTCLPVDPWNQCIDQVVFTLCFWGFHPMTLLYKHPNCINGPNDSLSVKFPDPMKKKHKSMVPIAVWVWNSQPKNQWFRWNGAVGKKGRGSLLRSAACDLGWPGCLVNVDKKRWKMAIEIVDIPMKNGGSFHRNSGFSHEKLWFTIEIVDLPSYKMVDLSSSQTVNVYQRVPSGNDIHSLRHRKWPF
jgi:hypothetical protein